MPEGVAALPLLVNAYVEGSEGGGSIYDQGTVLSREAWHWFRLNAGVWNQRSFHELQKVSKRDQLLYQELFKKGAVSNPSQTTSTTELIDTPRVTMTSLGDFGNVYTLPLFLDNGFGPPVSRVRSSHSFQSLANDSLSSDGRRSVLNGVTNWSLGLAVKWMNSLKQNVSADLSSDTASILKQQPSMASFKSDFNESLPPPSAPLLSKRRGFQSTRLAVRLHVWGPPLIHRLVSFPVKEKEQVVTVGSVIKSSFPPNMAEWILTQLEYGDTTRCSVTVEGITCDVNSPLVWWYLNCVGWHAFLEMNVRLPASFVE
eukprot:Blabericola_migrator_1__263@NODE_1069_length_5537_cov_108_299452_g79_i1_p3_GENE_NODE_1069_length_5537_cov_108_299452_g79_i1NODE_1069_length_5537_cov_108_299452_g79_i1_p3_ORF_typecomplete_len314_score49_59APG5/PF04106_12/0_00012_NODE_1069_length_5537_cov_108_299452_g79_i115792520